MICEHKNTHAVVRTCFFDNKPGRGLIDLQVSCVDCGRHLLFDGLPLGASPTKPMASPFLEEARLPFHVADDAEMAVFDKVDGKLS